MVPPWVELRSRCYRPPIWSCSTYVAWLRSNGQHRIRNNLDACDGLVAQFQTIFFEQVVLSFEIRPFALVSSVRVSRTC